MNDLIGILTPDGKFFKCSSYGHSSLATSICKKLGRDENGYYAENYLLNMEYIIFRARDCYMNNFKSRDFYNEYSDVVNESKEEFHMNFITEAQHKFINKFKKQANNLEQYDYIIKMLEMDRDIKEDYDKHEGGFKNI